MRLHLPAAARADGRARSQGTVLMVEDEETLRTVVDRILTDEGYRVLTAASGEEALELAEAEPGPIDLLVSDVVLGGMTGPELAAKLKARRPGAQDAVDVRLRGDADRAGRRLPGQAVQSRSSSRAGFASCCVPDHPSSSASATRVRSSSIVYGLRSRSTRASSNPRPASRLSV